MRKELQRISLAFAVALFSFGTVQAQNTSPDQQIKPELMKLSKAEKAKAQKELRDKYPLLMKHRQVQPRKNMFPGSNQGTLRMPVKTAAAPRYARGNTTIWANLTYKQGWSDTNSGPFGYYSFIPVSPVNYTQLWETSAQSPASNGVQYKDGNLYGLNLDFRYSSWGIILENLYVTNTETGETSEESLDVDAQLNLAAVETAQADDGTVYGEFYSADGQSYEWGTVDYSTMTRTTIGPATNTYVALGITKEGQLYGIASDGNLYKIDKSTGSETLVGPTGLTIANANGQFYGQTGEINQKDNTFYWAALQPDATGGLYVVDLQTGAATRISSSSDELYGMYIPAPEAEDAAPNRVKSATLSFAGTSLNGEVDFTAPTTTFDGNALSGSLTYTVKANNSVVAQGNTTPGATVKASVSLPESGQYDFVITTTNAVGESPKLRVSKYVGFDVPKPVSNVKANADGNDVTISWKAPSEGIHQGPLGSLTYDVLRINEKDTVAIATGITATSCTDHIESSQLSKYVYAVRANAEGLQSSLATSSAIVLGDAIAPDWSIAFKTESDLDLFTILNANNDDATWEFLEPYLRCSYNFTNGNDDWLFTPPIHMVPGRKYTFSFSAKNAFPSPTYSSFEVKFGNSATAEGMTSTLIETTEPGDEAWTRYTYDVSVDKEGKYYFGFHDNNAEPDMGYLYVDSISIVRGPLGIAPDSASNISISVGEKGALSSALSFQVPTKSVDGNAISYVDSLQILRNGTEVAVLPKANAGTTLTYNDNAVPSDGMYTYTIIPYLHNEFGQSAKVSAFIGTDIPVSPKSPSLHDNQSNVLATWDAFTSTGAHGGYLDPSKVSVSFFTMVEGYYGTTLGDSVTTSAAGATSMEIPYDPETTTDENGYQQLYYLAARADAPNGTSGYAITHGIVVGPTINIPYKESLKGGDVDNGFAWIEGNSQYMQRSEASSWRTTTDASQDNDGGSFLWSPYTYDDGWTSEDYNIEGGDECSINLPKISLKGASNPRLYFYLNPGKNCEANLKVLVSTPDGVDHEAANYDLAGSQPGWQLKGIDLSNYASERYVIVKFRGIAKGDNVSIGIDNVNIFDQYDYDLAATSIKAPESITAGKKADVEVKVQNMGAHQADAYKVVLYADDEPVDTISVDTPLPMLETDTLNLTLPVKINSKGDMAVSAKVLYDGDLKEDNNTTATCTVTVNPSLYGKVSTLQAEAKTNGVNLSWSNPDAPEPYKTTEDFEGYPAFSTDLGEWKQINGDNGLAGGFFRDYHYAGEGTSFGFTAFNPNAITDQFTVTEANPGITPHSGNQFAGAPYAYQSDGTVVDADNWLISPELSGRKQTISFYALNLASSSAAYSEKFDVMYSTTEPDTADFVKLESDVAEGTTAMSDGANWTQFSVELPEGAKYFAIRNNSDASSNFLFGVDDVSYEKIGLGTGDSIIAYNIYRDGKLIGSVKGNTFAFIDNTADKGNHVYNVTVVYQDSKGNTNESGFSNDASVTVVTGIDEITANVAGKYDVYTIDGKTIMLNSNSLKGLPSGLYIINGKKYIIK